MPYVNLRLRALAALGLLLAAAPGLRAQDAPSAAPPASLRGDVDGDGRVTPADAAAVRAWLVRGTLPAGRPIMPAGDANGDGRVTAADAALISRFAAGLDVSKFPVGRLVQVGPTAGLLQTGDQFCTVDLAAGTLTCSEVLLGREGASGNVILGTPYVTYVTTTEHSRGNSADEDTTTYTVRIRNATPQPLGTLDGEEPAPDGIRLFFSTAPAVKTVSSGTVAGAAIRLETPDGTATFTNQNGTATYTDRMYFQYDEVLAPGDTSAAESMQFIYSPNVTSFSYAYRVSAPAQYEHGWITLAPATTPDLNPGSTATFTGTVYNQVGQAQADGITWTSSNPSVATVDAGTRVVTAVAVGTATITATSTVNAQRTGTREITVTSVNTWEGDVSSDWSTAGNWSANVVPTSATEAVIPAAGSIPNMPVLSADAEVLDLSLGAGSTLGLGGFTLRAYDDVAATGTISNGTLWLSGSSAGVQGNVGGAVLVSGSAALQASTKTTGAVSVTGSLTVSTGALSISVP
jgi:hypothetical protein